MIIPLIQKDADHNEFTCRDGEIEFCFALPPDTDGDDSSDSEVGGDGDGGSDGEAPLYGKTPGPTAIAHCLTAEQSFPTANIRIPLLSGEKEKASLILNGESARVDAASAERITQAILQKCAETLLDLSTDLRRAGLFILPFRVYSAAMAPDGTLSYPTAQAVALPSDFPPHAEITAASATDDSLTLALRWPVKPHRLQVDTDGLPTGYAARTYISYPLYIPDPKEARGSIGSVRSATGGNTTGIRLKFLTTSAIKASVAAPEKYYEFVGNERTGYRISTKQAATPDYTCYAAEGGYAAPFPRTAMLAMGADTDAGTDPLDWIADWRKARHPIDTEKEGYLPISLPYGYSVPGGAGGSTPGTSAGETAWPDGIDGAAAIAEARKQGAAGVLLTRPMTFAKDSQSRRHAEARGIGQMRVLGLPHVAAAAAILYGSDDCVRWEAMRRFDPRVKSTLLTPRRLFWRLLIIATTPEHAAIEVSLT